VEATAVNDHAALLPRVAQEGPHLMDRLAPPTVSTGGTIFEQTGAVPSWTAPTPLRKTPLGTRLQRRECLQACRLSASAPLLWLALRGRGGRRNRGALPCPQPARGSAKRPPLGASSSRQSRSPCWARDSRAARAPAVHDRAAGWGASQPGGARRGVGPRGGRSDAPMGGGPHTPHGTCQRPFGGGAR
jgi:hypothetical protein